MDKLIVIDGDFETQLRRNLSQKENLDSAFTLQALQDNKFAVYRTHMDYLRAGAQIIRTNTYRASKVSFRAHLHIPESEDRALLYAAVQLAKQASVKHFEDVGHATSEFKCLLSRPLVAGSCGSYNATNFDNETETLKNINNFSSKFLFWFHKDRAHTLLDAGVDMLAFESIPSIKETDVIIQILKTRSQTRAWITFLCSPEGNLLDGTSFVKAVSLCYTALSHQIIAIGADCPLPDLIKSFMGNINSMRFTQIPFVYFVNKCHLPTTKVNGESIVVLQDNFVKEWSDNGVRYIGGGIGTAVEEIKEIHKQVNNYYSSKYETFLKPCFYQDTANQSKL